MQSIFVVCDAVFLPPVRWMRQRRARSDPRARHEPWPLGNRGSDRPRAVAATTRVRRQALSQTSSAVRLRRLGSLTDPAWTGEGDKHMSLWASRCLVLSWVFGLAACATAKLDTTRSITVKSGWFADGYEQDGQTLDRGDLADKLALHPVAGPKMHGYETTWWLYNGLSIVGFGLVSYDMGVNHIIGATNDPLHEPSYTLTFVGLGIAIAALPFMFVTNHKLGTAVHAYNGSLA